MNAAQYYYMTAYDGAVGHGSDSLTTRNHHAAVKRARALCDATGVPVTIYRGGGTHVWRVPSLASIRARDQRAYRDTP